MQARYFPHVIFIYDDHHEASIFSRFLEKITPVMENLDPFYKKRAKPFTAVSKPKLPLVQYLVDALGDQTNYLFIYLISSTEHDVELNKLSPPFDIVKVDLFEGFEKAKDGIINLIHNTALLNQRPNAIMQAHLRFYKSTSKTNGAIVPKEEGQTCNLLKKD